jgi:hypothetical protein
MKYINRLLCIIALVCLGLTAYANKTFSNETTNYKVLFKWGLINKQAGNVRISLNNDGGNYRTRLTASSAPWADKFYQVRDTLNGKIRRDGFLPLFYEKIAHEGNEDKHDVVKFERSGATVTGHCTRKKVKDGVLKADEQKTVTATGTTLDMLSAYYYMRQLPFESWTKGYVLTVNIFSGKRKELLTIRYVGTETITTDKKSYTCYHIKFLFTSDGRTKTSDDMDAWISTDTNRIPIKLEGKLPVGKVQCYYTGGTLDS